MIMFSGDVHLNGLNCLVRFSLLYFIMNFGILYKQTEHIQHTCTMYMTLADTYTQHSAMNFKLEAKQTTGYYNCQQL